MIFLAPGMAARIYARFSVNPAIPAVQKIAILDKLNARMGLQKEMRNLLAVLIHNDRIGDVHEVATAWRAEMQERLGIRQAEIVTARELNAQERDGTGGGGWQTGRFAHRTDVQAG